MILMPSTLAQRWLRVLPLMGAMLLFAAAASAAVTISEIRTDNPGTDSDEYFELAGTPAEALTGVWYVVLGDSPAGGCGVVEMAVDLSAFAIQPDGFFSAVRTGDIPALAGYDATVALTFENSDNVTHMLVTNFTGAALQDLDTNDDGVLDITPWTSIVDCVALVGNYTIACTGAAGTSERVYCTTTVGPGPGGAAPMHVHKCGSTWNAGQDGLPPVGNDTPGAANSCGNQAPTITNLAQRPFVVNPAEVATVQADVSDIDGTVGSVTLYYRINGGGFTSVAMPLDSGTTHKAAIPGQALNTVVDYYVQAQDNLGALSVSPAGAPATTNTYTVKNDVITPIATIHANLGTYTGTQVQIQAQVYVPGDYKGPGNATSAYVQDGSGRGINIFGDGGSFGQTLLNDVSNIVQITGTVIIFSTTTVELEQYDIQLVSTGNPPRTPAVQPSTAAAAAPGNEGTYVQSTGVITAIAITGTAGTTAHNFTISDGSGPVIVRVDDDLRADLDTAFHLNDQIVGRGAGSTFTGQGEILVGEAAGIALTGGNPPPLLTNAVLTAANQVTLTFNESIDPVSGNTAGNYVVFRTSSPATTIAVTSAAVQVPDSQVLLTLAANVPAGISHSVRVNNVKDLGGATIAANTTAVIRDPSLGVGAIQITEIMQNPLCVADNLAEWFEVRNHGAVTIDLDGWTMKDTGADLHVISNGGPLLINAGQYVVFARDSATLTGQGITPFYQYANFALGNAADEIILLNPAGTVVDEVDYTGAVPWPIPNGSSMQWNELGDNTDAANWGTGGHVFGCGDTATPGLPVDYSTPTPPVPSGLTRLLGNQPNPFNPSTTILFTLAQRERTAVTIYNARGQRVRSLVDAVLEAGLHSELRWDGRADGGAPMPSGVYFVQLSTASGHCEARKIGMVK
jgi:hypothetical protein